MKTSKFIGAVVLFGSVITTNALATNLIDIYKQASANDPQFKAANAKWLADREILSISRSVLMPQIHATGNFARNHNEVESGNVQTGSSNSRYYYNTATYSLQLTQSIFNFGSFASIWGAEEQKKKAEVTFVAAGEDLILRTAQAYFSVLQAQDVERFTKANKESLDRLLKQTKHKYDVGLIAITDLENTRAKYDEAVAAEIATSNDLANKWEQLGEITGVRYFSLSNVRADFPLISPQPADIERWVKAAEKQNFDLAAIRYATLAAKENIKVQNAGHLPTITATGGYGYNYNNNDGREDFVRGKNASVGLALNVPLFEGGRVMAQAKQANYQYQEALSTQEQMHRTIVSKTRQSYLGILASISKLEADKQAIKSTQSSLRATEAGYTAGTRTMVDVLLAQTQLYEVQKNFAIDEYNYIMQILTLKKLAGILDLSDLVQINSWLVQSESTVHNTVTAKAKISAAVNVKAETKHMDEKNDIVTVGPLVDQEKVADKKPLNLDNLGN